jgi:hypothetical protein
MSDMKGRRVVTPDGHGEVVDEVGDNIEVKLDSGEVRTYSSEDVTDDSSAG